jgi:hypothetical protein
MRWGGSPAAGASPTWLPPPPAGFWPPSGLGSRVRPYSRIQASLEATAHRRRCGDLHLGAGADALWIAFVGDNTASTYDFHVTHGKTLFRVFT